MEKIPKSFKLFATTIDIVQDNTGLNQRGNYGEASYSESKIRLSTTHGVNNLSKDKIMDTFYHEKIHIILNSMSKRNLSEDENFVEVFAKLLRQSDKTAKY